MTNEEAIKFFDEKIVKYVIGDLDELDKIQPEIETNKNSCAIPTAMLIFSGLDLIGFLLRDKAKPDDTKGNISECLREFPAEYQKGG